MVPATTYARLGEVGGFGAILGFGFVGGSAGLIRRLLDVLVLDARFEAAAAAEAAAALAAAAEAAEELALPLLEDLAAAADAAAALAAARTSGVWGDPTTGRSPSGCSMRWNTPRELMCARALFCHS